MSTLLLVEQTAPGTPSANQVIMYAKSDGKMYTKDDAGTESAVSVGAGGTFTGDITMSAASVVEAEGAAVVAASSTNIWATDGNTIHVTGNTGIADFATAPQAGAWMKVIFDGTPILTQSANLNLNAGGANITIEAGDFTLVYADTTTQMDVFVIRKSGAAIVPAITAASQAEMEAGSSNTVSATPGNAHWHPGVCKAWCMANAAGAMSASYNMTSVSDTGVGIITFNIATDFSAATWAANVEIDLAGTGFEHHAQSIAAGSIQGRMNATETAYAAGDPTYWFFSGFGDQA